MKNILSYAATMRETFKDSPFNRADALILCWLAYFNFPDYLKDGKFIALNKLKSYGLLPDDEMYAKAFNPKKSKKLFMLLINSPRFCNVQFADFTEELDAAEEKQFAALTVRFDENEYFISFRGTDPSFTGWKEDFNLACLHPIPSQIKALAYTSAAINKHPEGNFCLGGHSKGGNVAIYAAACIDKDMQSSIKAVFNFDGPGFLYDLYSDEGFKTVGDRIFKIVPKSSFVGMLLEKHTAYSVINSKSLSFLQHDPFNWIIKDCDFLYVKRRTHGSVRLERALNALIAELSIEDRKRFISLIYEALNTLDTDDFNVFFKTIYRQAPALYRQYKRLEPDDKKFFNSTMKRFNRLLNRQSQL